MEINEKILIRHLFTTYHKIPKISPGALFEGLIFGGAYLRRELCVSKSIGLALQLEVNIPFLLCFTLYLRAIFQLQAPRGLYLEGRFNGVFFRGRGLAGLYLEGLIHGGAYFRNFTVFPFIQLQEIISNGPAQAFDFWS